MTRRASRTPGRIRPLEAVLAYENPSVISRFQDKFKLSTRETKALFRETLRWLWLCVRSRQTGGPLLEIRTSMLFLDEMWHEFLMFTRDYQQFCLEYLGEYVHHLPTTRAAKRAMQQAWRKNPEEARRAREKSLVEQFTFIRQELGGDVLDRWVRKYKVRYPPEFMNARRLPYAG
jgi:hypothetical protein